MERNVGSHVLPTRINFSLPLYISFIPLPLYIFQTPVSLLFSATSSSFCRRYPLVSAPYFRSPACICKINRFEIRISVFPSFKNNSFFLFIIIIFIQWQSFGSRWLGKIWESKRMCLICMFFFLMISWNKRVFDFGKGG